MTARPDPAIEDGAPTSLLPKSMFPKAKVGDTIRVKVVAALEEELEVEGLESKDDDKDKDKDESSEGGDMGARFESAMAGM